MVPEDMKRSYNVYTPVNLKIDALLKDMKIFRDNVEIPMVLHGFFTLQKRIGL